MGKRISLIQGHPARGGGHFCHALADAYAEGAVAAGHEIRRIAVAEIDFPLLRDREDFERGAPPPAIAEAQEAVAWAEHLVIVYPLWLGTMPALLQAFFEQVFRPDFAKGEAEKATPWTRGLKGRSSRIVITMGMPALAYRWYFGAHSLKSLERNILAFVGIRPNRHTLIGLVEGLADARRHKWLNRLRDLGSKGA
jgi:putative NADPH-quinone reductase